MKKRLIIEIICAIVIFGIGYLVGDSAAINRMNKASTKSSTQTTQTSSTSDASSTSEKDKQKIYKVGEEGISGNWSIKVLDAQEGTAIQSGDGSDNKTTQQKFIIIDLQMTNISQAAAQYSDNEFALVNTEDKKQYQINSDASLNANQAETIYKKNSNFFLGIDSLNPGVPKQTYLVFEVPQNFNLQNGVLAHVSNNKAVGFNLK